MDSESSANDSHKTKCVKILKSIVLFLTWVSMGMIVSINTGTIPDFMIRMNTTVEQLSYAHTFGTFGGLIGALLAGFVDRFFLYADIIMGICMFLSAISNYFVPYVPNLLAYGFCAFLDFLAWQVLSPATNAVMLTMWETGTGSAMQAMQAGFPLGALLGGLIVIPFVSHTISNNQTETITTTESSNDDKFLDDSRIEVAFAIGAFYTALVGLCFVFLQFVKIPSGIMTRQENSKLKDLISPSKWANGDSIFGIKIFSLFVIFFVIQRCGIRGISTYLVPYAVDSELNFSNQEASLLNAVVFAVGGISRMAFIIIVKYLSVYQTLFFTVNGQLIVTVLLAAIGTKYKLGLWILLCCYAVFRDPIWPAGFTWGNNYIILLAFTLGLMEIILILSNLIITPLQGYLYTNTVIESIFYTAVLFSACLSVLLSVMYFVTRNRPGRFDDNEISIAKNNKEKEMYVSKDSEISYL